MTKRVGEAKEAVMFNESVMEVGDEMEGELRRLPVRGGEPVSIKCSVE